MSTGFGLESLTLCRETPLLNPNPTGGASKVGAALAAVAGLAAAGGVAAAAFAPLGHSTTYNSRGEVVATRSYSLHEDGIGWETGLVLGWFLLGAGLLLVFAFVAWRGGGDGWLRQALVVLGFLLTASALFLALAVGWLLLPAAALSLLAAVALWPRRSNDE